MSSFECRQVAATEEEADPKQRKLGDLPHVHVHRGQQAQATSTPGSSSTDPLPSSSSVPLGAPGTMPALQLPTITMPGLAPPPTGAAVPAPSSEPVPPTTSPEGSTSTRRSVEAAVAGRPCPGTEVECGSSGGQHR